MGQCCAFLSPTITGINTDAIGMHFCYAPTQSAEIRSKHAVITHCALRFFNTCLGTEALAQLAQLGQSFEGKRYGSPEDEACNPGEVGPQQDLGIWLQTAITS